MACLVYRVRKNPISHQSTACQTGPIRIPSIPCRTTQHSTRHDAGCHAGQTGSWIEGFTLDGDGGVAKPWKSWVPSSAKRSPPHPERLGMFPPCQRSWGTNQSPAHVEKEAPFGLLFACLNLLLAPSGPKEKTDIGRGIVRKCCSSTWLFSPKQAMMPAGRSRSKHVRTEIRPPFPSVMLR